MSADAGSTGEAAGPQALGRLRLLRSHLEDGVPLARVAREAGVAGRTARRWLADTGRPASPAWSARRAQIVVDGAYPPSSRGPSRGSRSLALRPASQPSSAAPRRIAADQGWPVPSYDTVWAIVRAIDPAMRVLAHEGDKRYREAFDLVHPRAAAGPNEIWQADHTELDLWVRDPAGRPARPWLTVIEDDYSRAVPGYAVSLEAPSALGTALAGSR